MVNFKIKIQVLSERKTLTNNCILPISATKRVLVVQYLLLINTLYSQKQLPDIFIIKRNILFPFSLSFLQQIVKKRIDS